MQRFIIISLISRKQRMAAQPLTKRTVNASASSNQLADSSLLPQNLHKEKQNFALKEQESRSAPSIFK
ncbi:hypothetical protein [Chryseobacterium hagamense]|uniref:hypothetical protein n=1 Tax=Chryseobacterium hagamense TaxID=395935 RepID=UPI0014783E58|nr:hypothetical protein [Chryseobacterium hagamense]